MLDAFAIPLEVKKMLMVCIFLVAAPMGWKVNRDYWLSAMNSPEWRKAARERRTREMRTFFVIFCVWAIIGSWPTIK